MLLEIVIPFILIIGATTNLVNFFVFTRPSLKGLSTFRFLAYLSIIDFFYLIIGLPHIMVIVYTGYDFREYSNFICSLHSFLTLYLSHVSSNILAGVGVFRCVTLTTLKPIRPNNFNKNNSFNSKKPKNTLSSVENRKMSCQLKVINRKEKSLLERLKTEFGNADVIILVIMFVIFLFDSHYLFWMRLSFVDEDLLTTENRNMTNLSIKVARCYPSIYDTPEYYNFYTKAYHWIDMFLYSYIPFAIMIISTSLIIYRLFQINKKLRKNRAQNESQIKEITVIKENHLSRVTIDSNSETRLDKEKNQLKVKEPKQTDLAKKRTKKNHQIYKLLLSLNLCFFILVTPIVLSNSLGFLKPEDKFFFEMFYILAYLNHSLNFLFYGLSCEMYRQILFDFLKEFFSN